MLIPWFYFIFIFFGNIKLQPLWFQQICLSKRITNNKYQPYCPILCSLFFHLPSPTLGWWKPIAKLLPVITWQKLRSVLAMSEQICSFPAVTSIFSLLMLSYLPPPISLSICCRNVIINWLMLVQIFVISPVIFVLLAPTPWQCSAVQDLGVCFVLWGRAQCVSSCNFLAPISVWVLRLWVIIGPWMSSL